MKAGKRERCGGKGAEQTPRRRSDFILYNPEICAAEEREFYSERSERCSGASLGREMKRILR